MTSSHPKLNDPAYLYGQLMATRALVLALAKLTTTKEDLRASSEESLEYLRTAVLSDPTPEAFLEGLNDFETWLESALD